MCCTARPFWVEGRWSVLVTWRDDDNDDDDDDIIFCCIESRHGTYVKHSLTVFNSTVWARRIELRNENSENKHIK